MVLAFAKYYLDFGDAHHVSGFGYLCKEAGQISLVKI